jgi:hypothetical protein
VRRGDPQRKKIALVATAHYLVRVMWALLKRGTVWEEGPAAADGPNEVGTATDKIVTCSNKHMKSRAGSDRKCLRRASGPERGGDPQIPGEVGRVAGGHPIGMSPASCRRAGVLIAAPCTPG